MLSSLSTVGVGVKLLSAKSKEGKAIMKNKAKLAIKNNVGKYNNAMTYNTIQ